MTHDQPAFPTYEDAEFESGAHALTLTARGLSKREWFAGQALAGMLACPTAVCDNNGNAPTILTSEMLAKFAVDHAEALLAQLAKRTTEKPNG